MRTASASAHRPPSSFSCSGSGRILRPSSRPTPRSAPHQRSASIFAHFRSANEVAAAATNPETKTDVANVAGPWRRKKKSQTNSKGRMIRKSLSTEGSASPRADETVTDSIAGGKYRTEDVGSPMMNRKATGEHLLLRGTTTGSLPSTNARADISPQTVTVSGVEGMAS